MAEYILDLEKSAKYQEDIGNILLNACNKTDYCYQCAYNTLCTFNINLHYRLRQAIKNQ